MKMNMYIMLLFVFFVGSSFIVFVDGGVIIWIGDGDGWCWEDLDNWEYDYILI